MISEKRKQSLTAYQEKNKEKYKEWKRQQYLRNKEQILESRKLWYQENREEGLARSRKKYAKNPSYYIQKARIRNYKVLPQQTPPWADRTKIKEFYINCPEGYHVDHIIPLRNELVSGLHVETNLQYLPAKDNLRKSNKW